MSSLYDDCARSLNGNGAQSLEPLRGSTLVVTGGSGFVGCWLATLCAHLNDRHNYGIDLVLVARSKSKFAKNAPHLSDRRDIRFVTSDVRQFIDMPARARWIIHAAANPDSRFHATNPMEAMDVIAEGTYRVLRAAEQCINLGMFLHFSSASVYGGQPAQLAALPEDHVGSVNSALTTSAYAEAKRFSEALCASARSQSRTPLVTVRPFTFIGAFQSLDAPWAINNFLNAALHQRPLKILGDGSTRRSYLYGSDAAYLALRILTAASSGAIFNFGHPSGIALSDLAPLVVRASGRPLDVQVNTGRSAVQRSDLIPDMSKVEAAFGFKPSFALPEAIDRTLAWHREREAIRA